MTGEDPCRRNSSMPIDAGRLDEAAQAAAGHCAHCAQLSRGTRHDQDFSTEVFDAMAAAGEVTGGRLERDNLHVPPSGLRLVRTAWVERLSSGRLADPAEAACGPDTAFILSGRDRGDFAGPWTCGSRNSPAPIGDATPVLVRRALPPTPAGPSTPTAFAEPASGTP